MTLLRIFKDQDGDVPVAEYREPDAIAAVLSEAGGALRASGRPSNP